MSNKFPYFHFQYVNQSLELATAMEPHQTVVHHLEKVVENARKATLAKDVNSVKTIQNSPFLKVSMEQLIQLLEKEFGVVRYLFQVETVIQSIMIFQVQHPFCWQEGTILLN